jgi:hypothetical protein
MAAGGKDDRLGGDLWPLHAPAASGLKIDDFRFQIENASCQPSI